MLTVDEEEKKGLRWTMKKIFRPVGHDKEEWEGTVRRTEGGKVERHHELE